MPIDAIALVAGSVATTLTAGVAGGMIYRDCMQPFHHPDERIFTREANQEVRDMATNPSTLDVDPNNTVVYGGGPEDFYKEIADDNPALLNTKFQRELVAHALAKIGTREDTEANRLVIHRTMVSYCEKQRTDDSLNRRIRDWQMAMHIPRAVALYFCPNTTDFAVNAIRTCDTILDYRQAVQNPAHSGRGPIATIKRWWRRRTAKSSGPRIH
nr:hypothetical protein [Tolivirales sp.]